MWFGAAVPRLPVGLSSESDIAPVFRFGVFFSLYKAKKVLQEFQVAALGRICHLTEEVLVLLFSSAALSSETSLWLWQDKSVLPSPFQSCC